MKFILALLTFILMCSGAGPLTMGFECASIRGFDTSSFAAYPSNLCEPYPVSWTGRFTDDYTTINISVGETFNSSSTYVSLIRNSMSYKNEEIRTLSFNVDAFRCLPGTYTIELKLNIVGASISCWQYSYSIS